MPMRLNRFLAQAGCGSRRACEELITAGRVTINGRVVTDLATQVEPSDAVKVGSRLLRNERTITAMLHKPKGYICTADDPEGRRTIFELLPKEWPRVFYVGRLDTDSEGLLLITNDGALGQRLTHPSYKLPKTYEVQLDRDFDFALADKLKKGLIVEGKRAKMDEVHKIGPVTVKVVLTQGIKRQIRMMFLILGYKVKRLVRTQIGGLRLGRLPVGQWDILTESDVENYFGAARLKAEPAPREARIYRPKISKRPFFRPSEGAGADRGEGRGESRPPFRKPPYRSDAGRNEGDEGDEGAERAQFPRDSAPSPRRSDYPKPRRPAFLPGESKGKGERLERSQVPPSREGGKPRPGSKFGSKPGSKPFRKPTGSRTSRPGGSSGTYGGPRRTGKPGGSSSSGPRRDFKRTPPQRDNR